MVSATDPQRRGNNPDDPLGHEISITDACVKHEHNSAERLVPDNGEYSLGNPTGSCWACLSCEPKKMDSSSGCVEGFWKDCVSGGGQYPTYKRTKYSADKTSCCLNASSTEGNKTCDPKYRSGYRSGDCNDVFENYCNSLDKIKNDTKCKNWTTINKGSYDNKIRQYCANSMGDSFCQDKAREIGGMDSAVNSFCATHRDDPFCACYDGLRRYDSAQSTTREEVKAILARPECYVSQCSSGAGYKYTNMRNSGSCPPANVCINDLKVINSENLQLKNVTMQCNQSISQNTPQSANTPVTNTPQSANTPVTNTPENTISYDTEETIIEGIDDEILFIFIAIFVFIIFGIILIRRRIPSSSFPIQNTSSKSY
jgi:hypothetical protein